MTPRAAPSPPADTRERLLDAAEQLFAERGLDGTAVRDIARRVGLTPASLYNHFAGKQALYEAVLERGVRPLLDRMQQLSAAADPPGDAEALIDAIMAHLSAHPQLPSLIQHEAVRGGAYLTRLARQWIRPLMEQGMAAVKRDPGNPWEEGEAPLVIAAWLHLVFGHFALAPMLREVFDDDPLSPEVLARQTRFLHKLARMMAGAAPRPESGPGR